MLGNLEQLWQEYTRERGFAVAYVGRRRRRVFWKSGLIVIALVVRTRGSEAYAQGDREYK